MSFIHCMLNCRKCWFTLILILYMHDCNQLIFWAYLGIEVQLAIGKLMHCIWQFAFLSSCWTDMIVASLLENNMWICVNVLSQAIIASNGKLTPNFQYIQDLRLANRYVIVLKLLSPSHVLTDFPSVCTSWYWAPFGDHGQTVQSV